MSKTNWTDVTKRTLRWNRNTKSPGKCSCTTMRRSHIYLLKHSDPIHRIINWMWPVCNRRWHFTWYITFYQGEHFRALRININQAEIGISRGKSAYTYGSFQNVHTEIMRICCIKASSNEMAQKCNLKNPFLNWSKLNLIGYLPWRMWHISKESWESGLIWLISVAYASVSIA